LSVQDISTIFYKSVQLTGYADNTNIMERTNRPISEVYEELKERAKEVGLNINVEKTRSDGTKQEDEDEEDEEEK
jgi:hypothetical protein